MPLFDRCNRPSARASGSTSDDAQQAWRSRRPDSRATVRHKGQPRSSVREMGSKEASASGDRRTRVAPARRSHVSGGASHRLLLIGREPGNPPGWSACPLGVERRRAYRGVQRRGAADTAPLPRPACTAAGTGMATNRHGRREAPPARLARFRPLSIDQAVGKAGELLDGLVGRHGQVGRWSPPWLIHQRC